MPLRRPPALHAPAGGLAMWADCVRSARQPCLLLARDGNLVALSATAQDLLGPAARPGMPQSTWWREQFRHSAPSDERSLLARTAASGDAAHSIVQLQLDAVSVTLQVLVAPLETIGAVTDALLVFLRPVTAVAAG